jgi:hypothetical protein
MKESEVVQLLVRAEEIQKKKKRKPTALIDRILPN